LGSQAQDRIRRDRIEGGRTDSDDKEIIVELQFAGFNGVSVIGYKRTDGQDNVRGQEQEQKFGRKTSSHGPVAKSLDGPNDLSGSGFVHNSVPRRMKSATLK